MSKMSQFPLIASASSGLPGLRPAVGQHPVRPPPSGLVSFLSVVLVVACAWKSRSADLWDLGPRGPSPRPPFAPRSPRHARPPLPVFLPSGPTAPGNSPNLLGWCIACELLVTGATRACPTVCHASGAARSAACALTQ